MERTQARNLGHKLAADIMAALPDDLNARDNALSAMVAEVNAERYRVFDAMHAAIPAGRCGARKCEVHA